MPSWVGNNQPMKMRETSRAIDKKLWVNNYLKKKANVLEKAKKLFYECGEEIGSRKVFLDYIWNVQFAMQFGLVA